MIQALEVAADTVDELAKGSEADQAVLEQHCKSFLETVKVHLLLPICITHSFLQN